MRNLVPVLRGVIDTANVAPYPLIAVEAEGDSLIALFSLQYQQVILTFNGSWNEWEPFPIDSPVRGLLAESGLVVLLTENGDIIEATPDGATVVGSLDTKILGGSWSPDHEVICIVTTTKTILLGRSYDFVGEHLYSESDLSLSKHVSVGWGKKETQFQGRGARALRDPTMPEHVDSGILNADDQGDVKVSWRGDGEFVAVNSIQGNRRVIKVYTRDGKLHAVSEPVDHLSALVAWQPIGAFIAAATANRIVFFERNGLVRSGFELPTEEFPTGLSWASDSEALAVSYTDRVEIWTSKNWHWYRKQVIMSTEPGVALKRAEWHPEKPRTLILQWANDIIETHTFSWLTAESQGFVCVIDANQVKITALASAMIPPPMSWKTLMMPSQPIHVATDDKQVAVVLEDCVQFYNLPSLELVSESNAIMGRPQQVELTANGPVVLSSDEARSYLNNAPVAASPVILLRENGYLCGNGDIYEFSGALVASIGTICADFAIGERYVFALTPTGQLLVSSREPGATPQSIAVGVSSIRMSEGLLLLTTAMRLKFIHTLTDDLPVVAEDDSVTEQCREIDRGSVIISVLRQNMAVVLQAPRGNIETVYPRILAVGVVRKMVREANYSGAFSACRTHRIDMNLLYDLDPAQFESDLKGFVEQLGTATNVDLFLSSLIDEDVTKTSYVDTSDPSTIQSVSSDDAKVPGKVNKVCELLMPYCSLQSQLTALALKHPPELGKALKLASSGGEEAIKHLCFLAEPDVLYRTALSSYDLKLALMVGQQAQMDPKEYLTFLREREKENTERCKFSIDDYLKDYSKALGHLLKVPDVSNDEVMVYVKAYKLHAEALELLGPSPEEIELGRLILENQASLWMLAAEYAAAGRNYELLGQIEEATHAYTLSLDWQAALSLDSSVEQAAKSLQALVAHKKYADAGDVCRIFTQDYARAMEYYCEAGRYNDAVLIARQFKLDGLNDHLRERFGVLQELFTDCASQIKSQARRLEEVRVKRKEEGSNYASGPNELAGDIADNLSIAGTESTAAPSYVTKYTDKTGGTAQTGASRRTQKNRRRDERKKARGKKGTVYEEDYLIASTGRLNERMTQTRDEAQQLVWNLERCKLRTYALQLVKSHNEVITLLAENVPHIYDIADSDLIRYNDYGDRYTIDRPITPVIPSHLKL